MVSGASYILAANFGKIDAALYASAMLAERIEKIVSFRKQKGYHDTTPTLPDIEKTHLLFVNSHFRPHVAIAREYQKVRTGAGTAALGGSTQFTINAFGDFYSDMVLRTRLARVVATSATTPTITGGIAAGVATSVLGYYRALTGNAAITAVEAGLTAATTVSWVTKFGQTISADATIASANLYSNLVRYCENPADRLVDSTSFSISGSDLDSYTFIASVMDTKFCVAPNKRRGHCKLIGQEVPIQGTSNGLYRSAVTTGLASITGLSINRDASSGTQSSDTVAVSAELECLNGNVLTVSAAYYTTLAAAQMVGDVTQFDVCRQQEMILNGPQTPRLVQPSLELWHKFKYWFNGDISQALTAANLPPSQRQLNVTFAASSELLFEEPNLYLRIDRSAQITSAGALQALPTVEYLPYVVYNGITAPAISVCELYVNNLFVNEEVHDIYIKRVGFSLMRAHRLVSVAVSASNTNSTLLQQLKWPIEYMFIGVQPNINSLAPAASTAGVLNTGNQFKYRDWHRMAGQVRAEFMPGFNSMADGSNLITPVNTLVAAVINYTVAGVDPATWVLTSLTSSVTSTTFQSSNGVTLTADGDGAVTGPNTTVIVIQLVSLAGILYTATFTTTVTGAVANQAVTGAALLALAADVTLLGSFASTTFATTAAVNFASRTNVGTHAAQVNTLDKSVEYFLPVPTVDTMSLTAHGIVLYDGFSDKFYNQYMPYTYGAERINTPEEEGVYFLTFGHMPGLFQPNDHLNTSRTRELYLDFTTSYVSSATPCQLIISASAINFLSVADNSANVRYLT